MKKIKFNATKHMTTYRQPGLVPWPDGEVRELSDEDAAALLKLQVRERGQKQSRALFAEDTKGKAEKNDGKRADA